MASPTFVGQNGLATNLASYSVNLPGGTQVGDLVVAIHCPRQSVAPVAPTGWTQAGVDRRPTSGTAVSWMQILHRFIASGETNYAFTGGATHSNATALLVFRNVHPTAPVQSPTFQSATGNPHQTPGVSDTSNRHVVEAITATTDTGTSAESWSWTGNVTYWLSNNITGGGGGLAFKHGATGGGSGGNFSQSNATYLSSAFTIEGGKDPVENSRSLLWGIGGAVERARSLLWHNSSEVAANRQLLWNIIATQQIEAARELRWNIAQQLAAGTILYWNILSDSVPYTPMYPPLGGRIIDPSASVSEGGAIEGGAVTVPLAGGIISDPRFGLRGVT